MERILSFLLSLILVSFAYGAELYQWVDKNGGIHFTDDESTIPPGYRDGVKTEKMKPSASPSPSSQKNKEPRVDGSGLGESYWRARIQPWKKQLTEARANLEEIDRKMKERYEEESGKHLTHTQWNMHRAERRQLIEERSKYEALAREANTKIASEAREAKADPRWLQ